MSIDSTSFGSMSDARFGVFAPLRFDPLIDVELSIGMPSTTKSGWALPDSDLMPRIRMYDDAPGAPELDTIWTFGAFAARALTMFDSLLRETAAESTVLMTVPSFS